MKTYIGTKVVRAEREEKLVNNTASGPVMEQGYKVVYEDGYVSWSPKAVFERSYREVTLDESRLVVDSLDYIDWPGD